MGSAKGVATLADPSDPLARAELIVDFGYGPRPKRPNYSVIGTDYETHTVVYCCTDLPLHLAKAESLWVLTREQYPSNSTLEAATKIMVDNDLPLEHLKQTIQTVVNCLLAVIYRIMIHFLFQISKLFKKIKHI